MFKIALLLALGVSVAVSQNFNRDWVGVTYSPYIGNWNGNSVPLYDSYSVDDIKNQLRVVNSRFQKIATYGVGVSQWNDNKPWDQADANCRVARAAAQINKEKNQLALSVAVGINQLDDGRQQREIDNAFTAAQDANNIYRGTVWALTFTNEYFYNEANGNKIADTLRAIKGRANGMGIKVGARLANCGVINENSNMKNILVRILQNSDYVMCNTYPANNVVGSPQQGCKAVGDYFLSLVSKLKAANPNIEIRIGETGWASQGQSFNNAPNSVGNLKAYWSCINDWATRNRVITYYFEAIDEPWKQGSPNSNNAESRFGWWRKVGNNIVEK